MVCAPAGCASDELHLVDLQTGLPAGPEPRLGTAAQEFSGSVHREKDRGKPLPFAIQRLRLQFLVSEISKSDMSRAGRRLRKIPGRERLLPTARFSAASMALRSTTKQSKSGKICNLSPRPSSLRVECALSGTYCRQITNHQFQQ